MAFNGTFEAMKHRISHAVISLFHYQKIPHFLPPREVRLVTDEPMVWSVESLISDAEWFGVKLNKYPATACHYSERAI